MKDLYEKFAYDYDEFGAIEGYLGDEKAFFEKLFKEHNVKTVLDCACGTGQHLYMLSEIGFEVSGSDYSESMLDVARHNLEKLGKTIPLVQCDFRCLEHKYSNTFDAIVCLTTALPHLHTDEDLVIALQSMKNRLNKNGLLLLSQGTTHHTLSLPSIEVVVNRRDFSRVFVKEHDNQFQTIHVLDSILKAVLKAINMILFIEYFWIMITEGCFQRQAIKIYKFMAITQWVTIMKKAGA